MNLLAYMPFINPINGLLGVWYLLLIPLAFGISVIYKALRMEVGRDYWFQVGIMTLQIVLAMIGLAVGLGLFVQLIIPSLVPA